MSQREFGTIEKVFVGKNDYPGVYTVEVWVSFDSGGQQFGGLCLDKETTGKAFVAELCEAFGAVHHVQLIGQPCYVLRAFDRWGERAEGLEAAKNGKRFTITGFLKRHYPEQAKSPLEQRRVDLERRIQRAEADAQRFREELEHLGLTGASAGYIDWET